MAEPWHPGEAEFIAELRGSSPGSGIREFFFARAADLLLKDLRAALERGTVRGPRKTLCYQLPPGARAALRSDPDSMEDLVRGAITDCLTTFERDLQRGGPGAFDPDRGGDLRLFLLTRGSWALADRVRRWWRVRRCEVSLAKDDAAGAVADRARDPDEVVLARDGLEELLRWVERHDPGLTPLLLDRADSGDAWRVIAARHAIEFRALRHRLEVLKKRWSRWSS